MKRNHHKRLLLLLVIALSGALAYIVVDTLQRFSARRIYMQQSTSRFESIANCNRQIANLNSKELQVLDRFERLLVTVKDKETASKALEMAVNLDEEIISVFCARRDLFQRVSDLNKSSDLQEIDKTENFVVRLLKARVNHTDEARYYHAIDEMFQSASIPQIDETIQAYSNKNRELIRIRKLIDPTWPEEWTRLTDLKRFEQFLDILVLPRR